MWQSVLLLVLLLVLRRAAQAGCHASIQVEPAADEGVEDEGAAMY
jgi:hypothetical protein